MTRQMHKRAIPVLAPVPRAPESELMVACAAGWLHVVRRLIAAGLDPNHVSEQGETPLTYAATWGHETVVACLLAKGAKVDSPPSPAWTPLMYASFRGNRRIVLALLINGADPQRRDRRGCTAVDLAKSAGRLHCASLIRSWGRED